MTGKLPPYREDCTVEVNHPAPKGILLFDLLTDTVTLHIKDYLLPSLPTEHLLISKYLSKIIHNDAVYDGKSGLLANTINGLTSNCSETISPILLLDGNYMAVVSLDECEVRLINSRNGAELTRFPVHGSQIVDLKVGRDDRTLYISTKDGRVLVLVTTLELCDPVTLLVRNLPSRQRK